MKPTPPNLRGPAVVPARVQVSPAVRQGGPSLFSARWGRAVCWLLLAGCFWMADTRWSWSDDTPQTPAAVAESPAEQPVAVTSTAPSANPVATIDVARIFAGGVPTTLDELRAMEERQRKIAEQAQRCTVSIRVGNAQGSGVIISRDGYVLTAAHVAARPNVNAKVVLSDGREVAAKTLGMNRTVDAGMVKINSIKVDGREVRWPYVPVGLSTDLKPGQWCLATGHPNGYLSDRAPVVRVGRILLNDPSVIRSDCKLVGGDSGGPLFDMEGNVIGIHSRIGRSLSENMHVPVNAFLDEWERLVQGEDWGNLPGVRPGIGVEGVAGASDAKIGKVISGRAADKAGIQVGDVILKFDGQEVENFSQLQRLVARSQTGKTVKVVVRRGEEQLTLDLVVENLNREAPEE